MGSVMAGRFTDERGSLCIDVNAGGDLALGVPTMMQKDSISTPTFSDDQVNCRISNPNGADIPGNFRISTAEVSSDLNGSNYSHLGMGCPNHRRHTAWYEACFPSGRYVFMARRKSLVRGAFPRLVG